MAWQTLFPIPVAINPIIDPSGAFSAAGDSGPVLFPAGNATGGPVTRTVTVRNDQHLFLPLSNAITWAEFSAYGGLGNLQRDAAEFLGISVSGDAPDANFFASLDGSPLAPPAGTTDLRDFRQFSVDTFDLTVPSPNLFGLADTIYPGVFPSVADGWWLMLEPLSQGSHTLHFGGSTTGVGVYTGVTGIPDITYDVTVVPVPESSLFALLCIGALGLATRFRRLSVNSVSYA